jgi:hypothetical protein
MVTKGKIGRRRKITNIRSTSSGGYNASKPIRHNHISRYIEGENKVSNTTMSIRAKTIKGSRRATRRWLNYSKKRKF